MNGYFNFKNTNIWLNIDFFVEWPTCLTGENQWQEFWRNRNKCFCPDVKDRLDEEGTVEFSKIRSIQRCSFTGRVTAQHIKLGHISHFNREDQNYLCVYVKGWCELMFDISCFVLTDCKNNRQNLIQMLWSWTFNPNRKWSIPDDELWWFLDDRSLWCLTDLQSILRVSTTQDLTPNTKPTPC